MNTANLLILFRGITAVTEEQLEWIVGWPNIGHAFMHR